MEIFQKHCRNYLKLIRKIKIKSASTVIQSPERKIKNYLKIIGDSMVIPLLLNNDDKNPLYDDILQKFYE